jgi:hypothetical protein
VRPPEPETRLNGRGDGRTLSRWEDRDRLIARAEELERHAAELEASAAPPPQSARPKRQPALQQQQPQAKPRKPSSDTSRKGGSPLGAKLRQR